MSNQKPTFVVTGRVRVSYEHLMRPYANQPGQEEKFSATLLIPKSDVATKQKLDTAIVAAIQDGVANKWGGVRPPQIPNPLHDGDSVRDSGEPYGAECKGHWVMTASSKQRPEIIDVSGQPIMSATDIYSGMYARFSINFYAYNSSGRKGIGCGLGNVQKLEDGEPLGGRTTAAADFGTPPESAPAQYQAPAPPQYQVPAQHVYQAPPHYQVPQTGINPISGQPIGGIYGVGV